MNHIKTTITYEDFAKLDIRVGTIVAAEKVEGSEKLIKLEVDFGTKEDGQEATRQILTGMAKWYAPEDLAGMQSVFVVNLAPRKMMGIESQGMMLSIGLDDDKKPIFLIPKDVADNGEGVR